MSEKKLISRPMTVARIIESGHLVEVMFLESAMFYQLARDHPDFVSIMAELQNSLKNNIQVSVGLSSINNDVIEYAGTKQ